MTTKPIDTFILNSVDLFKVNPSQSVISITYQPPKIINNNDNNNLSKITFKTNNPHLSTNYKFKTNKIKDVSRLLNSIGPNGVSIISNGILKKKLNKKNKRLNQKLLKNHNIIGLGTLLINDKVPEYKPITTSTTSNNDSKKKNNKNKNKKKR